MQVATNVRAVQVPDANPMHPQVTTIYLVGKGQTLTIDSGEDAERYRWMLKGYLAATEHAEIALSAVTHYHADHSANLRWLHNEFAAEVHVLTAGAPLMSDRLPDQGLRLRQDGETIEVAGGLSLQLLHTPGHSPDSVCYFYEDEGVLFTGDTILGSTTTTVNDLSDYMQSLERILSLPNLRLLCPGHGPVIDDPRAYIEGYVAHRNERERQILSLLSDGRVGTSWEIMESLYSDINPRLRRAADGNVRSHLQKLAKEGRILVHAGQPRDGLTGDTARDEALEHERLETIRRADEYREQARQRQIYLQENPPDADWLEPPRYSHN